MSRFVLHHSGHPTIVIIHSRNTSTAFRPGTRDSHRPNLKILSVTRRLNHFSLLIHLPIYVPNLGPATEYLSTVPSLKYRYAGVQARVPASRRFRAPVFFRCGFLSVGGSLLSAIHNPSELASYLSPSSGVEGIYQYLIRWCEAQARRLCRRPDP